MPRYRKKPVEIEARQTQALPSDQHIVDWINESGGTATLSYKGITIQSLEGAMLAGPSDYIIRGVEGEFYPCKAGIFNATNDAIPD